ncbi:PilZ domain-containing protein [Myxococcota bacterium]|nr:PilZ domain-containing protein [Myxococcota bacterium]
MNTNDPTNFDIDVDLTPFFGDLREPALIDSRWYEVLAKKAAYNPAVQAQLEESFQRILMDAQWRAAARQRQERRQYLRAPLLTRLESGNSEKLVTCDISTTGLKINGIPDRWLFDLEFNLPGLDFPIDAQAEVVSVKESNILPMTGLRFTWIDPPYVEYIRRYVQERRDRQWMKKVA